MKNMPLQHHEDALQAKLHGDGDTGDELGDDDESASSLNNITGALML